MQRGVGVGVEGLIALDQAFDSAMPSDTQKQLTAFFLLAYGIAWVLWMPLVLSKRGLGVLSADVGMVWMLPGSFAPALAAFLTHRWFQGNWRAMDFLQGWRRAWLGVLVAPALIAVGVVVIPSLCIAKTPAADLKWDAFSYYLLLVFHWGSISGGPLGEEPGWRGYALPRMQAKCGPLLAAIFLGVLWALWHLPLFLVQGWTSSPVPIYVLILTALSVLMAFCYNISGGNVLVAVIAHSASNSCSHMLRGVLKGAETRESPSGDLIIALSLAGLAALLAVATRGRIGCSKPACDSLTTELSKHD